MERNIMCPYCVACIELAPATFKDAALCMKRRQQAPQNMMLCVKWTSLSYLELTLCTLRDVKQKRNMTVRTRIHN